MFNEKKMRKTETLKSILKKKKKLMKKKKQKKNVNLI